MRALLSRVPKQAWWAIAPLTLLVLFVLGVMFAAAVDASRQDGKVVNGTSVGGDDVSGFTADEVRRTLVTAKARFDLTPINLQTPDEVITLSAGDLGAGIDVDETLRLVMDAGSDRGGVGNPFRWLGSLGETREIDLQFVVDTDVARDFLEAQDLVRTPPVEPTLSGATGRIELVGEIPGQGVDVDAVVAALPGAVARGTNPIDVEVGYTDIAPRWGTEGFAGVVAEAEALAGEPVQVAINDFEATLEPLTILTWLSSEVGADGPRLVVDETQAAADLEELLAEGATGGGEAEFVVEDQQVMIVPSEDGSVCCQVGAARQLLRTLRSGDGTRPVRLPGRPQTEAENQAAAEALGIVELVGDFTTEHACCQSRVTNIQRFADLMRGAIIMPGEQLSLNEAVGRRTRENGFVGGGAISNGVLETQIGGGVSQFATTFFNAAFFSGMEFVDYQSHSLYFSRYPYGREATISWPRPHLIIENPTPYAVLVWTSYTDTSITVEFYSTRHIEVEQTGQRRGSQGVCTRVTTERTRTYEDGSTDVDTVIAVYRPQEGINCDGSNSDPDATTTTTTTDPNAPSTTVDPNAPSTTVDPNAPSTTAPPSSTTTVAPTTVATTAPTTVAPTTAQPTTTTAAPATTAATAPTTQATTTTVQADG